MSLWAICEVASRENAGEVYGVDKDGSAAVGQGCAPGRARSVCAADDTIQSWTYTSDKRICIQ